jgi:hypothetical protein
LFCPAVKKENKPVTIIKSFQEKQKSGELEVPPKQELLTLIDSSTTIFNS